jgi:hypothetical protein
MRKEAILQINVGDAIVSKLAITGHTDPVITAGSIDIIEGEIPDGSVGFLCLGIIPTPIQTIRTLIKRSQRFIF